MSWIFLDQLLIRDPVNSFLGFFVQKFSDIAKIVDYLKYNPQLLCHLTPSLVQKSFYPQLMCLLPGDFLHCSMKKCVLVTWLCWSQPFFSPQMKANGIIGKNKILVEFQKLENDCFCFWRAEGQNVSGCAKYFLPSSNVMSQRTQ